MTFDDSDDNEPTENIETEELSFSDICDKLKKLGYLEYGSRIPLLSIHSFLNIRMPDVGTLREFEEVELKVVNFTGKLRKFLLKSGKTIRQDKTWLVIPYASDNAHSVTSRLKKVEKQLVYSRRLIANTSIRGFSPSDLEKHYGDMRRSAQYYSSIKSELKRSKSMFE